MNIKFYVKRVRPVRHKEVKRAWVAHFFNPENDEKPHTLIGIEVSDNWNTIVGEAGIIATSVPVPDPPVDFMCVTGNSSDDSIEDYFLKESSPFYKKSIWKFLG